MAMEIIIFSLKWLNNVKDKTAKINEMNAIRRSGLMLIYEYLMLQEINITKQI